MDNKIFEKFDDENAFIKVSIPSPVAAPEKAALNRKGNVFFNEGKIEEARRIFMTTGYSDGLTRVGDYYQKNGRNIEALRMYWTAPNKKKANVLIEQLAGLVKDLINENNTEAQDYMYD